MESQTLGEARQVRLSRIGRSQAIRIPRGFELPGGEATIRKVGDRLFLEPVPRKSLLQVLAAMTPLAPGDDFPDVDKTLKPLNVEEMETPMDGAAPEYRLRIDQPGARIHRCMTPDQGSGLGRNE